MAQAMQHRPVLLDEALAALGVRPDGIYVDCTFGRGGHARGILERLGSAGRLLALDQDLAAVDAAKDIVDERFDIVHAPFARLGAVLDEQGIDAVDGVLLDLGVSSPQIDDPERGFSFRRTGPLDMRMDQSRGETVAEWLAHAGEREIGEVIGRYGEERFAKQIAAAIVAARSRGPLASTQQLAQVVAAVVRTREAGQDPATRTFQALRIHVNEELSQLSVVLPQAVDALRSGGRLVVISFHSLEDRIVKNFMRTQSSADTLPKSLPLRADQLPKARLRLVGKAAKPSAAEIAANPRARSAVMRAAEKL